jgi:hypothetical protein
VVDNVGQIAFQNEANWYEAVAEALSVLELDVGHWGKLQPPSPGLRRVSDASPGVAFSSEPALAEGQASRAPSLDLPSRRSAASPAFGLGAISLVSSQRLGQRRFTLHSIMLISRSAIPSLNLVQKGFAAGMSIRSTETISFRAGEMIRLPLKSNRSWR